MITLTCLASGALAIAPAEALHDIAAQLAVLPATLLDDTAPAALQPTAGRFTADAEDARTLRFEPRYPFLPGREYALARRTEHGYEVLATVLTPAATEPSTTTVAALYPTARTVPLNLLRLYVQFSQPMSEAQAARNVTVHRLDTGEELHDVFLPHSLELWDTTRTRLTLLLDPGRIKRGLLPHQQMGYPLIEGVPIEVTVARTFRDAAGRALAAASSRRYDVTAALRDRIDITRWRLDTPAAGTRDPLTLTFDRPLDHALLAHCIEVRDASGAPIPGVATATSGECALQFTPRDAWHASPHTVEVDPLLEDLAGNSIRRVFDRDLTNPSDTPPAEVRTTLHFSPSASVPLSRPGGGLG